LVRTEVHPRKSKFKSKISDGNVDEEILAFHTRWYLNDNILKQVKGEVSKASVEKSLKRTELAYRT
jgi:hypothetical protein